MIPDEAWRPGVSPVKALVRLIKEKKMPPIGENTDVDAPEAKAKRVMSDEQKAKIAAKLRKYQRDLKAGKIKPGQGKSKPKAAKGKGKKPTAVVAATVDASRVPALLDAVNKYNAAVKAAKQELRAAVLAHTK